MAIAYVDAVLNSHEMQEFYYVRIVVERLAYAHHNDIGYTLAHILGGGDYLTEKLGRSEITHLSANCGGTECASHTATYL